MAAITFTFQTLLIVFSVSIFAFILALVLWTSRIRERQALKPEAERKKRSRTLYFLHVLLLSLFIAVGIFSIWVGIRSPVYFGLFAIVFISSIALLYSNPHREILPILILTLIIVSVFQAIIPIAENRLMVFGADQWTYIIGSNSIAQQGSYTGVVYGDPYYSTVPLFSLLGSVLTIFTGNVFVSSAILTVAINLVMALAIYMIMLKLSKSSVAGVIGVFVFLSIPHLTLIADLPSTISLAMATLLVLLIINYIHSPKRSRLIVIILLAFSTVVFHPGGILVIIGLCLGLVLLPFLKVIKPSFLESKITRSLLFLSLFLSLIYWMSTTDVLASIIGPIQDLIISIPSRISSGGSLTVYRPNYFQAGSENFAYSWAVPVGMSAAYVVSFLFIALRSRRGDRRNLKSLLQFFAFVAGVIGLIVIVLAFVSILNSPGASIERYMDTPAYLLILIPTALVSSHLIDSRKRIAQFSLIALLAISLFIGASSPDWAPFENPQFASLHYTLTGYAEAGTIVTFLQNNSIIISDHDIGVDGLAANASIPFVSTGTFQIARNILSALKNATFSTLETSPVITSESLYTVRVDEIQNSSFIDNSMDILYNSGMHITVKSPG
jgi:hypothetical protein